MPGVFLHRICESSGSLGENSGFCAGFERGEWRSKQFATHIMEWLPSFALTYSENESISAENAVAMCKKAAKLVYETEKYGKRGEFGEIILHLIMSSFYKTIPAISKIYYKSSVNKTVEGFDAVHVVLDEKGEIDLWVGEVKFYNALSNAITDVVDEIIAHFETGYLKNEFLLIKNKIDPNWDHCEKLSTLLNENNSLDQIFSRICVPVLLTYDSSSVANFDGDYDAYRASVKKEFEKGFESFESKLKQKYQDEYGTDPEVVIHLFLLPLDSKRDLVKELHEKLKGMQL